MEVAGVCRVHSSIVAIVNVFFAWRQFHHFVNVHRLKSSCWKGAWKKRLLVQLALLSHPDHAAEHLFGVVDVPLPCREKLVCQHALVASSSREKVGLVVSVECVLPLQELRNKLLLLRRDLVHLRHSDSKVFWHLIGYFEMQNEGKKSAVLAKGEGRSRSHHHERMIQISSFALHSLPYIYLSFSLKLLLRFSNGGSATAIYNRRPFANSIHNNGDVLLELGCVWRVLNRLGYGT